MIRVFVIHDRRGFVIDERLILIAKIIIALFATGSVFVMALLSVEVPESLIAMVALIIGYFFGDSHGSRKEQ